ncbi:MULTISPECIES: metallophosphoesterase [unclassified Tenacibaculum]|uniref:metallophosphoesterase n=1 Tax=unclassified Tenacibaculum TaxID=2635139 RepID=UPI001F2FF2D5|nr:MULTISPECIES: metallophosphoesterase [unclassified Tenacibaculum]MCF2874928.1 metallophosphoesterase [Tenacibaculum sp. Cn5-1]MCF2934006.1 metallophosphoesterase [Tenacibaculum sp. Cn5-34]MCG7510216.1 metallophosphoesterase [Tenacibaculum sp. Cn5-46]
MSRWLITIIIISLLIILLETYAFQAIKTVTKNKFIRYGWLLFGVLAYVNFFYVIFTSDRSSGQTKQFQWAFGFLLLALVPKLFILLFMLGEDLVRWIQKAISYFSSNDTKELAGRRSFIAKLAIGIAAIPFASLLYGIFKGKYNYKVLKYQLKFSDLPDAFDGFTITQITDIHSGSFTNKEEIQYGVDLINEQKSDVILFTGDIVNNFATEMDNWIDTFKQLEAPSGKYSILGNHDYGDYSKWESKEEKTANFDAIKGIHPKIGFDLLLNENRYLEKDGQKIALIGVENWGKGFNQAGDLQKASEGINKDDFKVLMSHDPSHWEYKVKKDDFNYQLTLSGHTHGLQFGIEIPGFIKWSPAKYVYKQWAGLYEEFGRYINVNRGFGYHAFPGRVGIWPEITVIELKKA